MEFKLFVDENVCVVVSFEWLMALPMESNNACIC